jgi:hypothetical protein
MTTLQVSWVPALEAPAARSDQSAALELTTKPLESSGSLLVPTSERYLVIPVRMLRSAGTNRVHLCGRVPWSSYQLLFGRPHPHSRRVKTEYHRRARSRGRRR